VSHRSLLPEAIDGYLAGTAHVEPPVARALRERTAELPQHGMQIGVDQAALLAFLVHLIGARLALEIGTFTGYSALAVANALPADGELVCCDISREWTDIACEYWARAGVERRIRLHLRPALETLEALLREGRADSFDFAFIDADKEGYDSYYERCLRLVRRGGLIAIDNMLWGGQVVGDAPVDSETEALRTLMRKLREDSRVEAILLSVGDGVALVRRR
jgi:predicted O-methyltransferase YrrM